MGTGYRQYPDQELKKFEAGFGINHSGFNKSLKVHKTDTWIYRADAANFSPLLSAHLSSSYHVLVFLVPPSIIQRINLRKKTPCEVPCQQFVHCDAFDSACVPPIRHFESCYSTYDCDDCKICLIKFYTLYIYKRNLKNNIFLLS